MVMVPVVNQFMVKNSMMKILQSNIRKVGNYRWQIRVLEQTEVNSLLPVLRQLIWMVSMLYLEKLSKDLNRAYKILKIVIRALVINPSKISLLKIVANFLLITNQQKKQHQNMYILVTVTIKKQYNSFLKIQLCCCIYIIKIIYVSV